MKKTNKTTQEKRSVKKKDEKPINETFIENVFKTNYKQHVLISYITYPFLYGIDSKRHTNYLECYTAAEAFKNLEYNVDVIMYNQYHPIDYSRYKVVYGMGVALENVFYSEKPESILTIMYSTGCNTYFSVPESVKRIYKTQKEKGGYWLQSARLDGLYATQFMLVDRIITLGNDFVASTFYTMHPEAQIDKIDAFYFDVCDIDINDRDINDERKHFLWFGSMGALHKGLDLVIDYFASQDDLHLHICGYAHYEKKFWDYYAPVIKSKPNLHYYGFIDIESELFQDLLSVCLFVILPSVSEGGAPSVLNTVANGGLIPIISKRSGIDVSEDHGWIIDDLSVKGVGDIIAKVNTSDEIVLKRMSVAVKNYFRNRYTYENYKEQMNIIIKNAIMLKENE